MKDNSNKLIDFLSLPQGLRQLSKTQLRTVAEELRTELIESISSSGGHFASSLGATEISVVLHALFDTPNDKLIWDVGHQGYIHKMLTGRRPDIRNIRKVNGISGFLKRSESVYDTFGAGHAGTSISSAVGMAEALRQKGSSAKVVAVIGDGSMTVGMAFEALNHAGELKLDNLIVVLNDNEMSISRNVGALSRMFSLAVTGSASNFARAGIKNLYNKGLVPEIVYKVMDRAEEVTQGFFATPAMLFESFGFRYIGPVDGNDIDDLIVALEHAKTQSIPVLVHARTVKGKGYSYAEADPIVWHGVTPFDQKKGKFISTLSIQQPTPPSYTAVFAKTLTKLADENPKIIGITAAMPSGTGLDKFQEKHPNQFYDVGICEQHAVTYAAGLATQGYRPVCAIYSTFLQRAYDQIVHDVCIQRLPVVFAIDRGGVVGNDGETHQGVFDVCFLRTLPNIVIMSPKDENELQNMIFTAVSYEGPIAVRYPRGTGAGVKMDSVLSCIPIGKAEIIQKGKDILFVGFGPIIQHAILATADIFNEFGLTSTIINARFAKPLDTELFSVELPKYPIICSIEDHAIAGGFGSALIEFANDNNMPLQSAIKRFGVGDSFVPHASQAEQYAMLGYDSKSIFEYLTDRIQGAQSLRACGAGT